MIAALAGGAVVSLAGLSIPSSASALTSRPGAMDPARLARDVFQEQDFWWKRIESGSGSVSWLESLLRAPLNFVGRILKAIVDFILNLLPNLFLGLSGASLGGTVLVCLAVVGLLVWAVWKLVPLVARWLTAAALPAGAQAPVDSQALSEASALFEQAAASFRAGMCSDAIRLALLALIARLQKQGLLRYDATRTNREYQRELRRTEDIAAGFGQLARIYERVWYGRMPAGRAEAEQAMSLCGSMINREDLASE
jgi:hypothetical protein